MEFRNYGPSEIETKRPQLNINAKAFNGVNISRGKN